MKSRKIPALFLAGAFTFFTCIFYFTYTQQKKDHNEYEGIIRLHVIANSDSKEDQELKLKVRDEVLRLMSGELKKKAIKVNEAGVWNIRDSRKYIKKSIPSITHHAESVIVEEGFNYNVSARLGIRWIPKKTYGSMYFPAGNYEALNVVIGNGKGENWWCVLFPPLCLIDGNGRNDRSIDKESSIVLRSKIVEMLNKK